MTILTNCDHPNHGGQDHNCAPFLSEQRASVDRAPVNDSKPPEPVGVAPNDPVDHPRHYVSHPSGVECITVTEHMGFNVGNAIKYLWRADEKGSPIEDLRKAAWYVNREIERRTHDGS